MNITINQDMTQEAVMAACHKATAIPSMIALYVIFGISLLLAGLGFKSKESSWGRFFWIWATTMIIVGVFLVFLCFSPGAVQWIVNSWEVMWS